LYLNLHHKSSVHLEDWPVANKEAVSEKLESDMELVRNLCQQAHSERQKACIKIRQPLSTLTICCPVVISKEYLNNLSEIMSLELNVKKVNISQEKNTKVLLDTNITPELSAEGKFRDLVRNIQVLRKNQGFEIKDRIKIVAPDWPKDYESQILAKTLADSIEKGDKLGVEKIS
jgi:isoleucyl-tRNA synthetase